MTFMGVRAMTCLAALGATRAMRATRALSLAVTSIVPAIAGAQAAMPPLTEFEIFSFIDNREASIFGPGGERISFGGDFSPTAGTTVVASNAAAGSIVVPYLDAPGLPNQFFKSIRYNAAFTGPWTISASNPAYSPFSGTLPALYAGPATPFITSAATNNLSSTPTFTWTQPGYSVPAGMKAKTTFFIESQAGTVLLARTLSGNATSFSVPAAFNGTSLQVGKNYVISLQTTLVDSVTGAERETSRNYFDYAPSATAVSFAGPVNLPQVDPSGKFTFSVQVQGGVPVILDPSLASGYVFQTGAGDPLFQSVALPTVGSSKFEIETWNGTRWIEDAVVPALDRYTFAGAGVSEFRVVGVDPGFALDALDDTAFGASVSFSGDGMFSGTMTPITSSVPEPPALLLLMLGLAVLHRRRHPR